MANTHTIRATSGDTYGLSLTVNSQGVAYDLTDYDVFVEFFDGDDTEIEVDEVISITEPEEGKIVLSIGVDDVIHLRTYNVARHRIYISSLDTTLTLLKGRVIISE